MPALEGQAWKQGQLKYWRRLIAELEDILAKLVS